MAGWESLGNVLGGGIRREDAFMAGQLHSAKTTDAIARAKMARDQQAAREELKQIAPELLTGPDAPIGTIMAAELGSDYAASMQGRLRGQEYDNRGTLGDVAASAVQRQAASDAVQGKFEAFRPLGAGGFYDTANLDKGVQNTPLGESMISENVAQAALQNAKRENPELYRAPSAAQYAGTPESIDANATAIANYQMAPLSSYTMRTPYGAATMQRALEINPDYQAAEYGSRTAAYKAFATGKQAQAAQSFGVALAHLETLQKLSEALGNNDVQLLNKWGNAFAAQTGVAAPGNFDTAKKIVADEIVKAIVGSGGGVADREEAARVISGANSPAQLAGVIGTYKELMAGQLGGLKATYEHATGRRDFAKILSPKARKYFNEHEAEFGEGTAAPAETLAPTATGADGTKLILREGKWQPL